MSRRRHEESTVAESDSFLDIVANIVGILIILIVIVGLRVGESTSQAVDSSEESSPRIAKTSLPPVAAPIPRFVDAPAAPTWAPIPPDPRLIGTLSETERELTKLQREYSETADGLAQLKEANRQHQQRMESLNNDLATLERELAEAETTQNQLKAAFAKLEKAEQDVQDQIESAKEGEVTLLRHELNPIGRAVRGKELHFRLSEGRISQIPLETMIDRLKSRIEQQKDWVAKFGRHEGQIGPFDGYLMEYVIERDRVDPLDEFQLGARVMRISVSGWKVVPQDTLVAETLEEALHANSRFQQCLRLADRDATLTFWVYPDSFAAYRAMQELAHQKGFMVAARPLPLGVPIAGSPKGSQSVGQ